MQPQYYGAAAEYNKPKGGLFNGKLLVIVGGVLVGLIVIAVMFSIIGSIASGPRNDVAKLSARAQDLQNLISSEATNTKDPGLKKINAETKLYLTTNILALNEAYGGDPPDSIVDAETDTTTSSDLEDANKAGNHDSEYAKVLKEKLAAIIELAQKVKASTTGKLTGAAAEQTATNMTAISDQLEAVNL